MTGFKDNSGGVTGWVAWEGDPNDDAAHQLILGWLQRAVAAGFLEEKGSLSNRVKGNLGEFIAYYIGKSYVFTNVANAYGANTWGPLSDISRPDLDIVWLHFGSTEADDWAALQEVKTTGGNSLGLADSLITDYEKLFGENLQVTLQTRLGALKNKLDQQGQGHLSPRVTALGGPAPNRARGIRLIPTLLHDAAFDSSTKMAAVRQVLIGRGWPTRLDEIKNFHHYLQSGTVNNHRASPGAKPAWKRAASYSRSGWSSTEAPDVSAGASGLWRPAARPECGKAACASSRARDGHGHAISGSCPLAPGIR